MYDVAPRRLRVSNPMARPVSRALRACTGIRCIRYCIHTSCMGPSSTGGPDGPVPGPARIRPRSWGVRRRRPAKSAGVSRSPASFGSRPDPPRPASKAIRLGLYTCILYLCIYTYIHIYIYGFLVCPYASSLGLAARHRITYSENSARLVQLAAARSRTKRANYMDLRPSARVPSPWTLTRSFVS